MEEDFPWCSILAVIICMIIGFFVLQFIYNKQTRIWSLLQYILMLERKVDELQIQQQQQQRPSSSSTALLSSSPSTEPLST
jgi:hypothetical protein